MSTTIRVSDSTRQRLADLAASTGRPMTQLVEEALDALDRKLFFQELNERYAELRADPEAWREIEEERRIEEQSRSDSSR